MATQDKIVLMHKVEGTLRPRMFANLLDEAVTEIQEHLDEFDITHISEVPEKTEDMLEAYLNAKRVEGRTEKTIFRYQYVIERFMKHAKAKTRDITTFHIREYFSEEHNRGIQDSTLEGIRQILNSYFAWLEHEKMIHSNPVDNVGAIKCEKKVRESFSEADIERMRRSCPCIRDSAIVNFLLSTGCRISEVTNLNRDDIDFNSHECIVYGKGKKERTVYLNEVAIMTLKEYLATRKDNERALFIGKFNERLLPGGVRAMLNKISELSGVKNIHPHRFRRTLITHLLNRGMAIQEVSILAGHDKMDTTIKYFSTNSNRIKSSYNKFY